MMQVVELADRRIAGLQHLDVELRRDRLELRRPKPAQKTVHHLAPGPETVVLRPGALGQTGHGPLEGVTVQVGHTREDGSGGARRGARRGALGDGGQCAVLRDFEQDIPRPAFGQQGPGGEQLASRHRTSTAGGFRTGAYVL
jgi:hypothetical protein